jgi:hypothetical protein
MWASADRTTRRMNTKKIVLATSEAAPAIPVNPKIAAISEMTKKIRAQRSMVMWV